MIEFAGTYKATIDDKGRIVLPSSLKKEMGELASEPLVLEKSLHSNSIDIHPNRHWQERAKAFKAMLDPFDEDDDKLLQFFYQNFVKVNMAANGRINIPDAYLKYAHLEKSVEFIGMGEYIRLIEERTPETKEMSKPEFLKKIKEKRRKSNEG